MSIRCALAVIGGVAPASNWPWPARARLARVGHHAESWHAAAWRHFNSRHAATHRRHVSAPAPDHCAARRGIRVLADLAWYSRAVAQHLPANDVPLTRGAGPGLAAAAVWRWTPRTPGRRCLPALHQPPQFWLQATLAAAPTCPWRATAPTPCMRAPHLVHNLVAIASGQAPTGTPSACTHH